MGSLGTPPSGEVLAYGRRLTHILCDLDDCLYQNEAIPKQVCRNIQAYMVEHLGVAQGEVETLTRQLYYQHGTTMCGLAAQGHTLDADHWHQHVHAVLDYQSLLGPQPATRQVLADLALQKHLFTNADAKHAAACLARMGLSGCFQSIWCYETVQEAAAASGLLSRERPILCKPAKPCFELVLQQIGAAASETVFVDDSVRNVAAAHELGILAVLVSPTIAAQARPHEQVAGADLVVASFEALRDVLPQVFVCAPPRLSEELPVSATVPVSVFAA